MIYTYINIILLEYYMYDTLRRWYINLYITYNLKKKSYSHDRAGHTLRTTQMIHLQGILCIASNATNWLKMGWWHCSHSHHSHIMNLSRRSHKGYLNPIQPSQMDQRELAALDLWAHCPGPGLVCRWHSMAPGREQKVIWESGRLQLSNPEKAVIPCWDPGHKLLMFTG